MKYSVMLLAAGVLLSSAGTAVAADKGWYAGVGVGQMSTEVDDILGSTYRFDESDTAFKVFGGYKFLPWLSVEGAYVDGGNPSITDQGVIEGVSYKGSLGVELQSVVAAAVFTLPIGERFELFAKPGVSFWNSTTDVRYQENGTTLGKYSQDDDGTAFFLGAGAGFNFNEHLGARVEYEWFDVAVQYEDGEFNDDLDATSGLWSVSFVYSF
jgi:OOP family OmpA-OmpF porin